MLCTAVSSDGRVRPQSTGRWHIPDGLRTVVELASGRQGRTKTISAVTQRDHDAQECENFEEPGKNQDDLDQGCGVVVKEPYHVQKKASANESSEYAQGFISLRYLHGPEPVKKNGQIIRRANEWAQNKGNARMQ